MEEFKHKILGFINKQGPKVPSMGFSDANYHFGQVETLSINSKTVTEVDRPADQDILESIQAAYFAIDEKFDICRFELQKLPEVLDCDQIQRDFKTLKQQHQVVSKKVLQLILEHQNACNDEFQEVLQILEKVRDTLDLCRTSRTDLSVAEKQFSTSLSILANYRKRKIVQNLLMNLKTIKTLYRTDHRLQELLNEENYSGAIELLLECQAAANTYRHFTCVAALSVKLQETLENTEEQLDHVLAQMCYYFDSKRYGKLQAAYKLLGKTQIAMDHLHMHYISSIYNTAQNIVIVYIENEYIESGENGSKKPYKKMCLSINQETFIPCLIDLCKSLFKIVLSYHQLVKWHNRDELTENTSQSNEEDSESEDYTNRQYIHQKLEHNITKIWQDVQSKVSSLLMNCDFSAYKFDQFLQVLCVVHRLIEVGEEFCGSKSEELQESIRKQSVNYFKSYHAQRLDELKIFLENESWEVCPVKPTFEILQLQEFKPLRSALKMYKTRPHLFHNSSYANSPDCSSSKSSNHSHDGSSVIGNYFTRYSEHGTPFDSGLDETMYEEDIMVHLGDEASGYFSEESGDDSDEINKEMIENFNNIDTNQKQSLNKDKKDKHNIKAPILTNTTLSVLRQMGKYMQMSRYLRPIAFDIIMCMSQFFDFYLYTVHSFFTADLTVNSSSLYSTTLNNNIRRISDNLVVEFNEVDGSCVMTQEKIPKPLLSSIVDLHKPEKLHGLYERIVGVESLIFLAKQYEYLQGYLDHLVPSTLDKNVLNLFFTQSVASAIDVRRPVYMSVCAQAFDLRQILISMSKVNWEVKDVMSQHNVYIDIILREIQIFTLRLEDVRSKVHIPTDVMKCLWENISHIVTHTLVQGFSEAKKCSHGGRALMQLDFTQFLVKFEKISSLRPVPHREYVETYVKAYYLPDTELEKWIREHTEYSSKHLLGLVSSAYQNNKKIKQRLISVIEDLDKGNPR